MSDSSHQNDSINNTQKNWKKPGILFVEDDVMLAESVSRSLRVFGGFNVYHAKTVNEAYLLAERYPTTRFVILDIGLPYDDKETSIGDYEIAGFSLLRDFQTLLPKARIYIKSAPRFSDDKINFMKNFKNIVRYGSGYNVDDIMLKAKIVYSDGEMKPFIFIVHGHNHDAKNELVRLLRDELNIGEPIVLQNEPNKGEAVIEKLEKYGEKADLVFALLTPDDYASGSMRARQNVIFEIGYFCGFFGRKSGRIILLHKAGAEIPSDMGGLLTINITNGVSAAKEDIIRELSGWWA
ncbi:TIR domain-containing protein [Methylobacterium tarhaniae]|uniref:TIR domain-containing protein n=1 Tax=Methylobacterium tarhaniae TaxID=1187852 RepID=UPI0009F9BAC4|nr:TIR domain-containing protein [Methylobacterium tarhaniae]